MTEIAHAHCEIAERVIRLWKIKQINNVDENLDSYISSTAPNNKES